MTSQIFLTWYFFLSLVIVGVYDIYALLWMSGEATVSYEIYTLGKKFPSLYLFLGILIGHIIFPLHLRIRNGPP